MKDDGLAGIRRRVKKKNNKRRRFPVQACVDQRPPRASNIRKGISDLPRVSLRLFFSQCLHTLLVCPFSSPRSDFFHSHLDPSSPLSISSFSAHAGPGHPLPHLLLSPLPSSAALPASLATPDESPFPPFWTTVQAHTHPDHPAHLRSLNEREQTWLFIQRTCLSRSTRSWMQSVPKSRAPLAVLSPQQPSLPSSLSLLDAI